MIRIVLVCSSLLAVAAEDPKPPSGSAAAGSKAKGTEEETQAAALAHYNAIRGKSPETAAAQWKLALWCEQNGLQAEAYSHFAAVVKLDPKRDAAWRKLG